MLDLNAIHIFTRVVETGSLSAAGRSLDLPKSTISRKLAALEEHLSVRLVNRSTRSLTLTDQGSRFYQRCIRIVEETLEAEQEVQAELGEPKGTLRISAPVEEGNGLLGPLLSSYIVRYPEVDIQLNLTNDVVDMIEGRYDLAIRAGLLPDSTLVAIKLLDERVCAFASPDYLARYGTPKDPSQLQQHHCLVYGSSSSFPHQLVRDKEQISIPLTGRVAVNSFELIKKMTLCSSGVGFIPDHYCETEAADGTLIPLMPEWSYPEGGIYAVYPSRKLVSPKVRSFIEHLRSHFSEINA